MNVKIETTKDFKRAWSVIETSVRILTYVDPVRMWISLRDSSTVEIHRRQSRRRTMVKLLHDEPVKELAPVKTSEYLPWELTYARWYIWAHPPQLPEVGPAKTPFTALGLFEFSSSQRAKSWRCSSSCLGFAPWTKRCTSYSPPNRGK